MDRIVDGLSTALGRRGLSSSQGSSSEKLSTTVESLLCSWDRLLRECGGAAIEHVTDIDEEEDRGGVTVAHVVRLASKIVLNTREVDPKQIDVQHVCLAVRVLTPVLRHASAVSLVCHTPLEDILEGCVGILCAGVHDEGTVARVCGLVEVVVGRGLEFEGVVVPSGSLRGPVRKKVMTSAVGKVGGLVVKGVANTNGAKGADSQVIQNHRVYEGILRAGLWGYPQALKGVVDRLWEVYLAEDGLSIPSYDLWVLLPRVTGSKEVWGRAVGVVMGRAHVCLDVLLDGVEARDREDREHGWQDQRQGEDHAMHEYLRTQATFEELVEHAHTLFSALKTLLTASFPTAVPFPMTSVLDLTARVVGVDTTRIDMIERVGRTAVQVGTLGVELGGLQEDALEVLRSAVEVCRGHAVPYMGGVFGILGRALESVVACLSAGGVVDGRLVRGLVEMAGMAMVVDGVGGARALEEVTVELVQVAVYDGVGGFRKETLVPVLGLLKVVFEHGASALRHANRLALEDILLHVAKTSHQLVESKRIATNLDTSGEAVLLDAVLEALEASVVAPSVHRPAHAAEALRLMRSCGRCGSRVGRLEMAMHPRSLDLRIGLDGDEVAARHELGVPRFWDAATDAVPVTVVVVGGAAGERRDHGDDGYGGTIGGNVGGNVAEEDAEDIKGRDEQAKTTGTASKRMARAAIASRTAMASMTARTAATDTTKRFKVSTHVVNTAKEGTGRAPTPVDPATDTAQEKRKNNESSGDEDDFLNMIDSGEED